MVERNIENIYPLTPQQQGMLFESLYSSEVGIFIEQFTYFVQGELDFEAFKRAWQTVVDRHSILRTSFVWKKQPEPLQVVLRHVEIPFERDDWRHLSPAERQERLSTYHDAARRRGFDLTKAPLMRLAVFQTGDGDFAVVWTFHHILMDGWCKPLVFKEFLACYSALVRNAEVSLSPVRPYRNYVAWLERQDTRQAEAFWRNALDGFVQPTPLGVKGESVSYVEGEETHGSVRARLDEGETAALRALCRRHGLTFNTLLQGVWAVLLSRYSGHEDVVFGVTVSGRPAELSGAESMVGLFINTLPLRVKVTPAAGLWEWLRGIQSSALALHSYEHCSAGQVHQWSRMAGSLPLYESILVVENYPMNIAAVQTPGLDLKITGDHITGSVTKHALTILAGAVADAELRILYDRRRFDDPEAAKISEHFADLLRAIIAEPEQQVGALRARVAREHRPRVKFLQETRSPATAESYVAPRTPTEQAVAQIWAEALGVAAVSVHDNLLALGAHSLLMVEGMSRIREAFQVELPLRRFYESPTVAGLALAIVHKRAEEAGDEKLGQLIAELENLPGGDTQDSAA